MSFNLLETSVFGGSPIELYEFSVLGQYWRYTTDDRDTVLGSTIFKPVSELARGAIRVTQNIERTELQVTMRGNVPLADAFRVAAPSEPVQVRIYKKHRGDPDYIVRWRGRIQSCTWQGNTVTFTCVPVHSSLKQPGLRRSFQYQCPHALYDTGCGVNRTEHEFTTTASSVSTLQVGISLPVAYPLDYFAGGYILWENDTGRQDTRMITSSTASDFLAIVLTLQNSTIGLSVGDALRLYPGCDHSTTACRQKFNNADRFGGFPFIPTTNPFGGATIY